MSGELVSPAAQTVEVPDHAVPPPESAHEANDALGHHNSLDNAHHFLPDTGDLT